LDVKSINENNLAPKRKSKFLGDVGEALESQRSRGDRPISPPMESKTDNAAEEEERRMIELRNRVFGLKKDQEPKNEEILSKSPYKPRTNNSRLFKTAQKKSLQPKR
jgi:hypothetical protein